METVFVLQGYDIGGDTRILVFRYLEDAKREKFEMEKEFEFVDLDEMEVLDLSLIHISEPTRRYAISYAVFCLKK